MKTRKNELRAEYPLSIMGAVEVAQAKAKQEGHPVDNPVPVPKDLYSMPSIGVLDQRQLFAYLTSNSVLMNSDHADETLFYTNRTQDGLPYWGLAAWDMDTLGSRCSRNDVKLGYVRLSLDVRYCALLRCERVF